MPLDWSSAAQAQLTGGALRAAILFRLAASSGAVRMWSGVGALEYGGDLIEPDAAAPWFGFGELGGLPQLQSLVNGEAERVEFKMSGAWLTPEVLQLATWEAFAIRSAIVNLGLMVLGGDLQPLSPVAWLWTGIADSLTVERSSDRDRPVRSVSLSVGSIMTGRRRPTSEVWTDQGIRQDDATDSFGMNVANYNAGTTRVWPGL